MREMNPPPPMPSVPSSVDVDPAELQLVHLRREASVDNDHDTCSSSSSSNDFPLVVAADNMKAAVHAGHHQQQQHDVQDTVNDCEVEVHALAADDDKQQYHQQRRQQQKKKWGKRRRSIQTAPATTNINNKHLDDDDDDDTESIIITNNTDNVQEEEEEERVHGRHRHRHRRTRRFLLLPEDGGSSGSLWETFARVFFLLLLINMTVLFFVINHVNLNSSSFNYSSSSNNNKDSNRLYTFESYNRGRLGRGRLRYLQENTNFEITESINITIDPSNTPTIIPNTTIPTLSPSEIPTSMPTISASPTISPQPTGRPTENPSSDPSSTPTEFPTISYAPTSPSAMPSQSFVPTVSPAPTTSPSNYPTTTPTLSLEPSGSPISPSQQPSLSNVPTTSPSSQPTGQPTQSIQPSLGPTISSVPTDSAAPSSSPTTFTPAPTFEMRNDTSPDIVMVLDGVPIGGLTDEQKAIWEVVTSQHVMDFHNTWTNSLWDEDGSTNNETTPSTNPPTTSEVNQTMLDSDGDGGLPNDEKDDEIPIMMPPSTRQSSPTLSSGSDDNDESLSPFEVVNVTTNLIRQDPTEDPEGTWPNTSVVRIYYTQTILYVIKNPDLIPKPPPESDDEMGDNGVESAQRTEYEEFRDELLFILPFQTDSFDYSAALVDALDLENWVILDSCEVDTGPTPAPTPAPVPETSRQAVAWSASLVVGACIIVAFLMWDRHRKNAKYKYDGDDEDDEDDDDRANNPSDYNTADFDNAGQPVDWTNPYSDPSAVEVRGGSRHRSRPSGAGFSAGESSVSSTERMRTTRSSGGTPGRGGNSNYGTATFSDDGGREGALNAGTFGTIGTLTTVMSSSGPTPQGSNRERDRISDRRSGGRGVIDPNLPPLPIPRFSSGGSEHVRTSTWSSANETPGTRSNGYNGHTRSVSGMSRGSGAYGSPTMVGHRVDGRQTSITDTELTDLTFNDGFNPTDRTSDITT
eukprot:CAMPEP_0113509142 /NCGR_PEP_ID=MMETSP0014_2-20120614/37405_1 /TAXON_ID=2857 /ORGANISM="Nitzschia sp." /LENGTH=970 /DNA_ID=CAMNT_0000404927 /DNA_START=178 /DNA_END=3086 /DNA_ORIENTATION=+ /assembly_acc=CAM_ASM_000159